MNTLFLRKYYGLSQADFATIFRMSVRTVENWDFRNTMPEYAHHMASLYFRECEETTEHKLRWQSDGIIHFSHEEILEETKRELQSNIRSIKHGSEVDKLLIP